MMEFGKTLRQAREAKGLTVTQLAETTKLAPAIINDLENEVFAKISAPIYGRGFVKLYCEAVGLEAKPLVSEYMAIVNGTHEPSIRERPAPHEDAVVKEEPPPEPPVAAPPVEPPAPQEQPNLFSAKPAFEEPSPSPAPSPSNNATDFSRYAMPIHADEPQEAAPSRAFWRMGVLGTAVVLLLALVVWAIVALYRATAPEPEPPANDDDQPAATPTAQQPAAGTPRSPQKIPPLYFN